MMKRALILLLLTTAACARQKDDQQPAPTALVTTAQVQRASIDETVTAYGSAEIAPDGERTLTAPVEAVVTQVLAPAGTLVKAGQPVAVLRLSPTSALELSKARQDAVVAEAAYARAQRLRASGLDSDADVETARAAAAAATDAARSLEGRAGGALTLRAPLAGVVESLALAPGDVAAQGAAVAKVGSLGAVRIRLGVDPRAAGALSAGAAVRLSPLSGGGERAGTVAGVDPRLDAQTRLASVIVRAPSAGLSPGEPLKGVIVVRAHEGAVVAPRAALLYEGDQPYVFVAAGGAAHRHDVRLGVTDDQHAEILQGLAAGERVVVDGASALDDGMAVREAAPAKAASE
ncbi:MAG: efflux RND transporter periplasmic adaptor subunit [Caulobacteraceae bacterium]|nr:efflux RND transporter periplasmic adaptor subunit [Caulobacteraceae bacterium]